MSESRPEDEESLCTLYLFLANLRTIILSRFASELAESIFLSVNNGQERKVIKLARSAWSKTGANSVDVLNVLAFVTGHLPPRTSAPYFQVGV